LSGDFRIGETHADQYRRLQLAEEKKREAILKNDHLQKYVKSLTIGIVANFDFQVGVGTTSDPSSMLRWNSFAAQNKANFEHLHLQIVRGSLHPASGPVVPLVRQFLASPSLKSVTLDIAGDRFMWNFVHQFIPLPEWILQSISSSITKLGMIAAGKWHERPDSSQSPTRRPVKGGKREPCFLEDASFTMVSSRPTDKIGDWAARLGEPYANFNISRAKKLYIKTHVTDNSLWSLSDQASATLEELTVDRVPCG
jgi:hypothetical protein